MEIKTLEGVPVAVIAETFNEAFADYKIKFKFTEDSLTAKFLGENIKPEASAGVFADGKPVGFILHGIDDTDGQKSVFNAGTVCDSVLSRTAPCRKNV